MWQSSWCSSSLGFAVALRTIGGKLFVKSFPHGKDAVGVRPKVLQGCSANNANTVKPIFQKLDALASLVIQILLYSKKGVLSICLM